MQKDDFTNNLRTMRDIIEADYKTIDKDLREDKYKERIAQENAAATINYYQLALTKRHPILPDPTLEDYEETAKAIQGRKDKLEADILSDIEKEFDEKGLIGKHINAYFYDEPSRERAREHLFHPARTAFNEKSEKSVSQIFVEQVGQKVHEERDQALLQEFQANVNQPAPSRRPEQDIQNENPENHDRYASPELDDPSNDIPELEVHDFDPNEFVPREDLDYYPAQSDHTPREGEPLDLSKDSSSPSEPNKGDPKGPDGPGPNI